MNKLCVSVIGLAAIFVFFLLGLLMSANAAQLDWPAYGQFLMVDQHGNIQPSGYTAGLSEIAAAEAQAAAAQQAAQAVAESTSAASNVVDQIVSVLTGAIGFGYVQGHVVSFSGAVEVFTNAAAQLVLIQPGAAGNITTNGIAHTGHYVWHAYSEAMNSMPAIKYKTNLDATNAWQFVQYQSTSEYNNTTVNGVLYETIYRSTVWLPSSLNSAFFLAFCEISGGGQAGGYFDVVSGFSINGKKGFTGDQVRNGYVWHYECGALMSVTNEVAP